MFFGPLAKVNNNSSNIEIDDIEPDTFKNLISYIYEDSYKCTTINEMLALFSAAHKYMMQKLIEKCVANIIQQLTITDAVRVYEAMALYEQKDIQARAMQVCTYCRS